MKRLWNRLEVRPNPFFLIIGASLVIAGSLYTVFHLNDKTIYWFTVPEFIFGMILMIVSFVLRKKI